MGGGTGGAKFQGQALFLGVVVVLWYITNGLNSIHVKRYMKQMVATMANYDTQEEENGTQLWWVGWMGVSLVTTLQLFAGTALAWLVLALLPNNENQHDTMINLILRRGEYQQPIQGQHIVHAAGSFFTSLGFYYGSAALVQIIKLLEPVQTLLLAEYIVPLWTTWQNPQPHAACKPGHHLTWGVLLSTSLIVASSMSLLFTTQQSSTTYDIPIPSVLASLASGFTLSLRNIFVKRSMHADANANATQNHANTTNNSNKKELAHGVWRRSKLLSFANLSYLSALLNLVLLAGLFVVHLLWSTLFHSSSPNDLSTLATLVKPLAWETILYHPSYNFLSILVLSLVAVLSHALLNVGKRVSSIVLSVLYFQEQAITPSFLGGLVFAALGGLWHIHELGQTKSASTTPQPQQQQQQQQQPQSRGNTSTSSLNKPMATIVLILVGFILVGKQTSSLDDFKKPIFEEPDETSYLQSDPHSLATGPAVLGLQPIVLGIPLLGMTERTPRQLYGSQFDQCQVVFRDRTMSTCHLGAFGGNFGDMLGPDVVKRIVEYHTGCSAHNLPVTDFAQKNDTETSVDVLGPCLFTVGSVMRNVRRNDHVWGTGMLGKNIELTSSMCRGYKEKFNNVTIYSVRGPQTAAWLEETCLHRIQVYLMDEQRATRTNWAGKVRPYGDAGFLVPFIFPEVGKLRRPTTHHNKPRFDSCVILHHYDQDKLSLVKKFENESSSIKSSSPPNVTTSLPVIQPWRTMAANMSDCAVISSSSMHGLILADAYGIPAVWVQDSTAVFPYKFQDYYKSMGNNDEGVPYNNKTGVPLWMVLKGKAAIPNPLPWNARLELAQKIIASFPYHLFETVPSSSVQ